MSVPLSERIRSDLEAGKSKEDVVRDLVAEGLSQKATPRMTFPRTPEVRRPEPVADGLRGPPAMLEAQLGM